MEQGNHSTKEAKRKQITEKERYKIEGFLEQGLAPAQIAELIGKTQRIIEREKPLGLVGQKRMNPSYKKNEPMYIVEMVYKADTAQMRHEENASRKGRGLKIGSGRALAAHIEDKIKNEKWSPDAIIGRIKVEGLRFETSICTKTAYNYIDREIFAGISNRDL
ncbi:hypothetical protein LQZ18_14415 [Lachnospiraceae bacterium ZAX-1]